MLHVLFILALAAAPLKASSVRVEEMTANEQVQLAEATLEAASARDSRRVALTKANLATVKADIYEFHGLHVCEDCSGDSVTPEWDRVEITGKYLVIRHFSQAADPF